MSLGAASPHAVTDARTGVFIVVEGRVQGVGFRPFVLRLALQHGVSGWVRNCAGRVEIAAGGNALALDLFVRDIVARAPPLARPRIDRIVPGAVDGDGGFIIRASEVGDTHQAELPPDLFVCNDCLAEMADPAERRYRYPFINCTQCGPRYSIIRALPYDRANTTMASFDLCPACRAQYSDPADRRYHAQPLACPACGPRLWFRDRDGDVVHGNDEAIAACIGSLASGRTVAVKGVGGYHLVCDATCAAAVARLRARKRRPAKPFAVMVQMLAGDPLAWARRLAHLDAVEEALLLDPIRPIVLVRRRQPGGVTAAVAPGIAELGLMLPYSPLHHLLLQVFGRPIVVTSANISGEPVLTDGSEVETRLASCCDAYLHHDRPIHRTADDPVIRAIAGRGRPIRLGRGTAPLSLDLPCSLEHATLACGGQMRVTVALGWEHRAVISPHVGDMGSVRSSRVFAAVAEGLQQLYAVPAKRIACDAHPGFTTRTWARRSGQPVSLVHHHCAHASALAGEHGVAGNVLVFTWDGVGLGMDGGVWGGEALHGGPGRWRRVGCFRPLRLVGGDAVSYQPWRSGASVCWALGLDWQPGGADVALVRHAWERSINAHESGAVGRLFDAAAAILGLLETASYDGQAPAMLEALTRGPGRRVALPVTESDDGWTVDWEPLMRELMESPRSLAERAESFHSSLAASILDQAQMARTRFGCTRIGLTGGVFQNRRLTEEAVELLRGAGFDVLLHERVPPNDGGLSYGQLVERAAQDQLVRREDP